MAIRLRSGQKMFAGILLGGSLALGMLVWAPVSSAACQKTGTHLEGGTGADILCGTSGNDTLNGNGGNDELHGFLGDDTLLGGEGDDLMDGSFGNDVLTAGPGNDRLVGGPGADLLTGNDGLDEIHAGEGSDTITGGEQRDFIRGEAGNDVINARDGVADYIDCGPGTDTVDMDLRDYDEFRLQEFRESLSFRTLECENVFVGAVQEGPNVVLRGGVLHVGNGGAARVRLRCPGSLDIPCAGTLTVAVVEKTRKRRSPPVSSYSLVAGASGTVAAHLSAHDHRVLRRRHRATGSILSVEKGHFGNKTTIQTVTLRA